MKTTDARVREEQGCSTARPHVPAGRGGPGKGDPGMRRESPRALLPGSPIKQAEVLRDTAPGHPRSGVRISGSAVPAACAVSPAWVPCRGAGGSGQWKRKLEPVRAALWPKGGGTPAGRGVVAPGVTLRQRSS